MIRNYGWKINIVVIVLVLSTAVNLLIYSMCNNFKSKETIATVEKVYGFTDSLELIFSYENLDVKDVEITTNGVKYEIIFYGTYKEFIPIAQYLSESEEVLELNNINICEDNVTFNLNTIKNK